MFLQTITQIGLILFILIILTGITIILLTSLIIREIRNPSKEQYTLILLLGLFLLILLTLDISLASFF